MFTRIKGFFFRNVISGVTAPGQAKIWRENSGEIDVVHPVQQKEC